MKDGKGPCGKECALCGLCRHAQETNGDNPPRQHESGNGNEGKALK